MVAFKTSRFGPIEVNDDRIIRFPVGLLGFPHLNRYILMDNKDSPVKWLQAVDDPDVAFVVADPRTVAGDRPVILSGEVARFLQVEHEDDVAVLLILRVDDGKVIANFNGPLAINSSRMLGVQVVLDRG